MHFRDLLLELTRPFKKCQAKASWFYYGFDIENSMGREWFSYCIFIGNISAAQAKEQLLDQVKEASKNSDVSQIYFNLIYCIATLQIIQTCHYTLITVPSK